MCDLIKRSDSTMDLYKIISILLLMPLGISCLICACNSRSICPENQCATDGKCFKSLKFQHGFVIERMQCLNASQLVPPDRPFLCDYNHKHSHIYIAGCCDEQDLCNFHLNLTLDNGILQEIFIDKGESPFKFTTVHIIITSLGALVLLLTAGCIVYLLKSGKCKKDHLPGLKHYTELETQSCETAATTLQEVMNMSSTGSGSGLPLLLQRTIARQIQLKECIGKGRFGEVHRGEWRGENVAVKIFSSVEEQSWFREVEIYQTSMLRHDNILGFIAADNKDNGMWTQLWLVTQYMELGSLFDFLSKRCVSDQQALDMCVHITTGLAHLHLEIIGTQGKPAIAHRDLKSKNILVRHDGVCAIGDLGLAVRYFSDGNYIDIPANKRVGTKRYLSPEVLDDTIVQDDFESYKQGDIYALGLVFWEIVNRVVINGESIPYRPPYWDVVGIDPSIDEMRKVVCIDQTRPELPDTPAAGGSELIQSLCKIMSECWYSQPTARLSVLRVKKSLGVMKQSRMTDNVA